jgi:hypothetical protein
LAHGCGGVRGIQCSRHNGLLKHGLFITALPVNASLRGLRIAPVRHIAARRSMPSGFLLLFIGLLTAKLVVVGVRKLFLSQFTISVLTMKSLMNGQSSLAYPLLGAGRVKHVRHYACVANLDRHPLVLEVL